ncbi:O-methyltransferase [Natronoflexus pectinivorans]|uniref:Putative O-methyltransferase YrrM n=1 Tax=Natronoflexus pectinivorans TaxID=682526 RepID=A0A4R2GLT2_9BACT|nr:O-methyltransferase [Natronoflexus pectinivorans]TCO09667.1 putative O-methyltransferase YrrM [Natronoflexus pectinivorans]
MQKKLEQYILDHINDENPVLKELERYTYLHVLRPRMLSGHLQGSLLTMLCRMIKPANILEIGTYTGYSSICMAYGCADSAHIHTIEINDELEHIIRKFHKKAGVENKITLHIGDAIKIIERLNIEFDLIFIDGDKRQYPEYYKAVLPKTKPGGFILADNILWDGKVAKPNMPDDAYTKGIMDFNCMVKEDTRVEKTILPVRDGITLICKK